MTMVTVCQFNKYGFCKFGETCRHLHLSETCENKLCETSSCPKRHPKTCRYFSIYNRCKFGSFCFFNHEIEDLETQNGDDEMKTRLAFLEDQVIKLEAKIKDNDVEIKDLEEKSQCLERKLETVVESMKSGLETTVKKVTEEILKTIVTRQDVFEKKQIESFDLLNQNLSCMIKQSQPSSHREPQAHSQQNPRSQTSSQPSRQSSLQCDICGKSFGSEKALANHTRKDHTP